MSNTTLRLVLGDSLKKLKDIPSSTIDAIISDPPYGLEFMGSDWDAPWKSFDGDKIITGGAKFSADGMGKGFESLPSCAGSPNPCCQNCGGTQRGNDRKGFTRCKCEEPDFPNVNAKQMQLFQAWCEVWAAECYRILKPGGVMKVFSGTRTFHRMAKAMKNVGFADFEVQAWTYGCLSADSDILTEHGWKPGSEVQVGEKVACWDSETGQVRLEPVEVVFQAPFNGEMIRFKNDNTDQMLTPNHRVYKKHRIRKMTGGVRRVTEEPGWTVQEAGAIDRWNNIRLPLAGIQDGPGIGGVDRAALLAWVWTEGGFDTVGKGVRIHQSSVNAAYVQRIQALVEQLVPGCKRYDRVRTYKDRTYTESCWFFTGPMADWVREMLPGKRPPWSLLWAMSRVEKLAFVEAALQGDGSVKSSGGAFYQKNLDDLVWFQTLAHMMNRQGRVNFRKCCVGLHMNPETQLQSRHLKAVVSEKYDDVVWCVKVPTGAFFARRADKIFITGNSGFPKSLNVSKAIDKEAGATRADLGPHPNWREGKRTNGQSMGAVPNEARVTAPATDAAKTWEGYGTALKPAFEPIVVARKPVK